MSWRLLMRQPLLFSAALVTILFGGCAMAESKPNVAGNDAPLATAIYQKLSTHPGNLLFSPYSVRSALTMVDTGARGNTAAQIAKVLDLPDTSADDIAGSFATLNAIFNGKQTGVTLAVASALWGQERVPFDEPFVNRLGTQFNAPLHRIDFTDPEPARNAINDWVARHTNDRIKGLFPAGSITPDEQLVLANAVYFKGSWNEPFEAPATKPGPFHLSATSDVSVPLMHSLQNGAAYAHPAGLQVVNLPYQRRQISMTLLVPDAVDGVASIEAQLDAGHLHSWLGALSAQPVSIALPKFKLSAKFTLNDSLSALGMPDAFDRHAANFSGMLKPGSAAAPLFIGAVIHQADATIDEQGTEAAAATGIGMMSMAMARQVKPPVVVTVDRPFVLLIRHADSGAILFMGRVSDPR